MKKVITGGQCPTLSHHNMKIVYKYIYFNICRLRKWSLQQLKGIPWWDPHWAVGNPKILFWMSNIFHQNRAKIK